MNICCERRKNTLFVQTHDDDGRKVSWGQAFFTAVQLNGAQIPALRICGVGTVPECRRMGLVREYMKKSFDFADETGACLSLLHPFSFAFYRKFGFTTMLSGQLETY